MTYEYDYLVIGSGIAGMSFALKVAGPQSKVALICKTGIDEANTALAQGGVASVTNLEVDDFEKHIHDTMVAGDWLSDPDAVRKVVTGAPEQIRQLLEWGVDFDRKEDGGFDLHREGGHSEFRILHHADNTGFEIQQSLIKKVRENPYIDLVMEQKVRNWAPKTIGDTLFVCKGGTIDDEKQILTRIQGKMIVPKYFYMALLLKKNNLYSAMAFWAEHIDADHSNDNLRQYVISIDELEERTGIDFFCNLPDDIENKVENKVAYNYWGIY